MNKLVSRTKKLRPKSGFSNIAHLALVLLLPLTLYVLVSIDFPLLAWLLVVLSKWRMFAVRPRYWIANIQANAVDILVGLSTVVFMSAASSTAWQLYWAGGYALWLIFLKPGTSILKISLQAMVAQLVGLMALFIISSEAELFVLILASWFICYISARHFFTSFEEPHTLLYSHTWGYFAAALIWVLGHWLLFYGVIAQPTVILTVVGYGLGTLYYLDHHDRLSKPWRRQFVAMMVLILSVVLILSDWGDKAL